MVMATAQALTPNNDYIADPGSNVAVSVWHWAKHLHLKLQAGPFLHPGHEYLADVLDDYTPNQVNVKGAQMGFTEAEVLKTLHGMIYGRLPVGALHLFPTSDDVGDFSKARFNTLIDENPQQIGQYVQNTDAVNIKRVAKAMLYLRGAKSTKQIEGLRKTSSKLKSIAVDRIVFDERDEMESEMVDLAMERISHSEIKETVQLSTPSVPDFGIDLAYKASDQSIWIIPCGSCGFGTCLEIEFPKGIERGQDGIVRRVCVKCGKEIFPAHGQWVRRYEGRDVRGRWISQLNSAYINPSDILKAYESLGQPGALSRQEFYNSKLARAYVESSNRLTPQDFERCLTQDAMLTQHEGPAAMGVDVGSWLHVVIGIRPNEATRRIIHLARVKEWNDVHNLAMRFGVQVAVIDGEPERHKAREFQEAEPYLIYLCDYQEGARGAPRWNVETKDVVGNRTELLDRVHTLVTGQTAARSRIFELPYRSAEVDQYITESVNMVKVLVVDRYGGQNYVYKALGPDHYRHATVYFDLACERISTYQRGMKPQNFVQDYDPLNLAASRMRDESTDYDPLRRQ